MASTTLPERSDTFDWREGLVVLPEDHVYGATALTVEEWAQVVRRHRRDQFVLVDSDGPKVSPVRDFETAMQDFVNDVTGRTQSPGTYAPDARRSLRVVAATEVAR